MGRYAGFRMFQKLTGKDNKGGMDTWKIGGGVGTGRSGGWDPPSQTSLHGAASSAEMRMCREAGRAHGEGRGCRPSARWPGSPGRPAPCATGFRAGGTEPASPWLVWNSEGWAHGSCSPGCARQGSEIQPNLCKSPTELAAPDPSCSDEEVLLSK